MIVCVDLAAAIVSFIILIVCPIGIFLVNKLEKLDDRVNVINILSTDKLFAFESMGFFYLRQ